MDGRGVWRPRKDDKKFLDDDTITLKALTESFGKEVGKEEKKEDEKLVLIDTLDPKLVNNLNIALSGRGLIGQMQKVVDAIITCDIISDDGNWNVLNAPGPHSSAA